MNFGSLLKHARKDRGLSLKDLSQRTGIAGTNLQRMESGTRPPPARGKIVDMARALSIDQRSTDLLLFLVGHSMPEVLAHLALQDRAVPLEDFESASLMRFLHVSADALSKPTWSRIVHKISQAREDAEREACLTVTDEIRKPE